MSAKRSELKQWAKENMKGVENLTLPSFTRDLSELDEEGIRWDVRKSIEHGFFSTCCSAELGLSFEEAKRFVKIVSDEGKGKILVSTTLFFNTIEQNIEMAKYAASVGCHTGLLGYPATFTPDSAEEIYEVTRDVCDASDLAIIIYPTHKHAFEKFHPSGFPLELLGRMAEIDNVVAAKIGSGDMGFITECFERCSDKVLVNANITDWAPVMVSKYSQQWIGSAVYEIFQSPEKPYLVNYFNLLLNNEYEKAMEIYWKMRPLAGLFESHIFLIMQGAYPWNMFKYYQWLVGGNGGLTREAGRMATPQMMMARFAYMAAEIITREPDEEFYAGRVNYAKQGD